MAKPLVSKAGVCAFDSHHGYVTVDKEVEVMVAEAVEPAHSVLCRPERSPEEKALREVRRKLGFENGQRLLAAAEEKAMSGQVPEADALVRIAQAWDNISY